MLFIVLSTLLGCNSLNSPDQASFQETVDASGVAIPSIGGLFSDNGVGMVAATNTPDNSNPYQDLGWRGDGFAFEGGWDSTQLTAMAHLNSSGLADAFGQTFDYPGEYLITCAAGSAVAGVEQGWCAKAEQGSMQNVLHIRECDSDVYDYCVGWTSDGTVYRPECSAFYTPPTECPDSYVADDDADDDTGN